LKRISSLTPAIQAELEGNLLSHKGQLLSKLGLGEESVECLKLAYKIFAGYDPYDPREAAWGAENLANGIATINNFPEAVRWQEKAREHWLDYSRDHSADKTEWAAILKKSMGTTLLWAGQRARARDILTEALKQMESETPYNWAMVA
jgi:tetratricopeptide (TPR) repeat protein